MREDLFRALVFAGTILLISAGAGLIWILVNFIQVVKLMG